MKKLICLFFCLLLVTPVLALAQTTVDLTTLTNDELLALWQAAGDLLKEVGAYPYTAISKGDEGVDITNLQQRLIALYYFAGDLTGKFDANTQKAVKAFEKANGLKADGALSIDEQQLLYSNAALAKATPTPSPSPTPAPTPVPENAVLEITEINLRDHYNTKVFSVKLKNQSASKTLDAFTLAHRSFDTYGELLSVGRLNPDGIEYAEWWKALSIKPGKTFSMGSYFWYLFDQQTCSRIEVAVSKYHTTDGGTITIAPEEYIWVTGSFNKPRSTKIYIEVIRSDSTFFRPHRSSQARGHLCPLFQ